MSKDPAFLFYYKDFLVSTMLMSPGEVGSYIRILCQMADKGPLSMFQLKQIAEDGTLTEDVLRRLPVNDEGLHFSPRLSEVMQKRKKFRDSRIVNLNSPRNDDAMETHMVNVNVNENRVMKTNKQPSLEEVTKYFKERGTKIDPVSFHAYYEARGWMLGPKKPVVSWKACLTTWEQRNKEFVPPAQAQPTGRPPAEVVALQCVALKMDNKAIKEHMLEKGYTEHRIDEAIMKARGDVK